MKEQKEQGGAMLPRWNIILKNDETNSMEKVIVSLCHIFGMDIATATTKTLEIHLEGKTVIGQTHFELAETLMTKLNKLGLNSSIEKA